MRWIPRGRFFELEPGVDWRSGHAQLPVVDSGIDSPGDRRWRIWYSSRDADNRSHGCYLDIAAGDPGRILAAPATPVLSPGTEGEFDEHGAMPCAVLHRGGETCLYYIGWSRRGEFPYRNAIGVAISSDGDRFEKYPANPLFPADSIDPFFTGTLNLLACDGGLLGYYMSCTGWQEIDGRPEPRYHLRIARSRDGFDWQREGRAAIDFRDSNEGGIVSASVLAREDDFAMWYSYRGRRDFRSSGESSYRIGYAESADAFVWTRRDAHAGIARPAHGWDSEMQCYPCVVRHGARLYLFYNGNGFGRSGIGYATADLG